MVSSLRKRDKVISVLKTNAEKFSFFIFLSIRGRLRFLQRIHYSFTSKSTEPVSTPDILGEENVSIFTITICRSVF